MFFLIAAIVGILVTLGVQIWYARSFTKAGVDVGIAAKIVWGVNIALLLGLAGAFTYILYLSIASGGK